LSEFCINLTFDINQQEAVIIGQCLCTIPEGFCAKVLAKNFFRVQCPPTRRGGGSLGVCLDYLSSLCWLGNRDCLSSLLTYLAVTLLAADARRLPTVTVQQKAI